MNFNELFWHDSVIKKIEIDRSNPGEKDIISFEIEWNNNLSNRLLFHDVYWAKLSMNFGIIASESIDTAFISPENDIALINFYERWKGMLNDTKLFCYVIKTISTGSEIKIIAGGVKLFPI